MAEATRSEDEETRGDETRTRVDERPPGGTGDEATGTDTRFSRTADERRAPDNVSDLSSRSWKATLKRAFREFSDDNVTDWAAALTYYAVLSVVPGLIVLVSILGLTGKDTTRQVVSDVKEIAPGSSAKVVQTLISQAQAHHGGAGLAPQERVAIVLDDREPPSGPRRGGSFLVRSYP